MMLKQTYDILWSHSYSYQCCMTMFSMKVMKSVIPFSSTHLFVENGCQENINKSIKRRGKKEKEKEVISFPSVLRVKSIDILIKILRQKITVLCLYNQPSSPSTQSSSLGSAFSLQQFVNQLLILTDICYHPKNSYRCFHAENSFTSLNKIEVMIGRQMRKSTSMTKIDISKNVFVYTC